MNTAIQVPGHWSVFLVLGDLRWVDGNRLGGVVGLVDADQAIGLLEHVGPERDDDELGVAGPLLDEVGHDGGVLEVQGSVDLVHEVEGSRLVVV